MNEGKYILFFLGALGAFNGLVISLYLLFILRKKTLSSFFLGCLLLALSIRIGKSVFASFNPAIPKIYLQIGLSGCFLIGPFLYYFVRATLASVQQLPRSWKFQMAAMVGIILVPGALFPYQVYPKHWNNYIVYFIYATWFLYMIAAGTALRRQWAKLAARNTAAAASLTNTEKWVMAIYTGSALIFISFSLALLLSSYQIYFSGALIFSLLLYLVIFIMLYKRKSTELFPITAPPRYATKKVNEQEAAALLQALDRLMIEKEMFKNPNLTLPELAKAVNWPGHQLSQVLNDNLGKNFTTFVNEYRIEAACKMIAANHPFSLEAIGYEVGFNSKSTFYTSFRKIKATTPLLYKESLEKRKAS
jgi:AraC-like DNA-binding protein